MPLQHKHSVCLHLAPAAVSGEGGSHSLLPSSRRGICGICFPSKAQAKQSRCRTPQRIWFPSPRCKSLLLLSNTLLQIRSGLQGFRSVTLRIRPQLTTENAPGFSPPKSVFAGQTPLPAPCHRGGFPAGSAFSLASRSPSVAPSPLAHGCLAPPSSLARPTECGRSVPQIFGPHIRDLRSSWSCSCFGSWEKAGEGWRGLRFSYRAGSQPEQRGERL